MLALFKTPTQPTVLTLLIWTSSSDSPQHTFRSISTPCFILSFILKFKISKKKEKYVYNLRVSSTYVGILLLKLIFHIHTYMYIVCTKIKSIGAQQRKQSRSEHKDDIHSLELNCMQYHIIC